MTMPESSGDARQFVYYLRKGDRIKIGFSSQIAVRMRALKPDTILAVEPGTVALEKIRHDQFAECRLVVGTEREWYSPASALMKHIGAIAAIHADQPLACWLQPRREPLPLSCAPNLDEEPPYNIDEFSTTEELVAAAHWDLNKIREIDAGPTAESIAMASLRYDFGLAVTRIAEEMGYSISKASRLIKAGSREVA